MVSKSVLFQLVLVGFLFLPTICFRGDVIAPSNASSNSSSSASSNSSSSASGSSNSSSNSSSSASGPSNSSSSASSNSSSSASISASRAVYYGSPDCQGTTSGACGFGEYGKTINGGQVTSVSKLYANGSGCGACYQVICTNAALCSDNGTTVVVTDYGGDADRTDFILSIAAYNRLSRPGLSENLFSFGIVDVVFTRVPCQYNSSMVFKVKEDSRNPGYLAIVPYYQPGAYEITAIEIWLGDCKVWKAMRRVYGAVFDFANPPCTNITLRFQISVNGTVNSSAWVQLNNVLPADWKAGFLYDTGIST